MEVEETRVAADVKRRNRRRVLIIVMVVFMLLSSVAVAAAVLLGDIKLREETTRAYIPPLEEEEEDPNFADLYDVQDAANLKEFLREWWYNGGDEMIRYSKDVLNVVLVGVDNNDGEAGAGRSDSMMLVSVNKKTRMISMLSFLRDSYCYFTVDGSEYYHRLNSSYYYGGAAGLMETLTRLYKIRVDKYITVDFRSFPKLIDALGGVTVDVTEAEARYINRNSRTHVAHYGAFPSGEDVHLNGQQALVYSRIRKLDTDVERTNRQQKVIESIIRSARGASLTQLRSALDEVLPYVHTNFSKGELLTLLPSAAGWTKFGTQRMSSPALVGEDLCGVGSTINGMSILVVDYPKAARQAQLALYGESNITIDENGERAAYIAALFQAAADHTRTYPSYSAPTTEPGGGEGEPTSGQEETQPIDDYTQPQQESTARPFWPFQRPGATAAPATEPPGQEPETAAP